MIKTFICKIVDALHKTFTRHCSQYFQLPPGFNPNFDGGVFFHVAILQPLQPTRQEKSSIKSLTTQSSEGYGLNFEDGGGAGHIRPRVLMIGGLRDELQAVVVGMPPFPQLDHRAV